MATVNIRRDVKDNFYRYKMERIQSKIEGKGNGIKTVIVNLTSIANSLARPGAYVIKYFGFELGAQTNNNPADDRWIINGAHEASKLQDYLDGFINKFVLCKECKNPETEVIFKEGNILLDCKACGKRSMVDPRLKLSGFIMKNQPSKKSKKDKAEKKAARKAKADKGESKENGNASGSENASENGSNDNNGDVVLDAPSDDELVRQAEELQHSTEVRDDDWAVDMSPEAIKARQQQLPDDLKQKLVLGGGGGDEDDEEEGGGNSTYDQLANWIEEQTVEKGDVSKVDDLEIYLKAKEFGIEAKHRTLIVLALTLFDENIVKQIPKRAGMLKNIITSEKHEKALLGGMEKFIGQRGQKEPEFYEKTSKVLMVLYDQDILSEEVITKWGTKASRKYTDLATSKKVRKSAEEFLTWLAEAESDDDDSE
ncbi:eukaryotic translation initiation factor 5 [Sclerotinia borealis F-4128]|uniref:Eukaryotic translation initiation factor 5 n=1 Tax=Sclerotinia borealis (strain F-4128) TaxID=1432307 RepID=W9CCS4_SCLBF|nr:eukaryotic translation initiation factor 5 [Sclerotinia borealis F-4128]